MDGELASGRNEARIIELHGGLAVEIQLQHGRVCLVDVEDWELVRGYRWHWKWENRVHNQDKRRLYVVSTIWIPEQKKHRAIRMHRLIMDAPRGLMVDHIVSEATLDNRRSNLRLGTNSNNQANSAGRGGTSRFKGVSWNARKKRWLVAFRANGQYHFVGYFKDEEEAARAFDAASLRANGPFARPNFPDAA